MNYNKMTTLTYKEYCSNKRKLGEYYGYPDCCIEAFIGRKHDKRRVRDICPRSCKAARRTGFIPCDKHAEEILRGSIRIEDLIVDRKCETRFPNGDDKLLTGYRQITRSRIYKMKVLEELKRSGEVLC
jgi:hypothetical protein